MRAVALPRGVWWATLVGLTVRLVWAVAAARTPTFPATDAAIYLRMAEQLAHGHNVTFGGEPSAFYALGYPILLAPFVAIGSVTGWFGAMTVAAALNVVLGAATIPVLAVLARLVFSDGRPRGAVPAPVL